MSSFRRRVRLEAGPSGSTGIAWEGLRIAFRVEKTSTREPDSAEIQVWNLNETSRAKLRTKGDALRLLAGYGRDEPSVLFAGKIEDSSSVVEAPDRITTITADDGGLELRTAVLFEHYAGPVQATTVFRRLVERVGLPLAFVSPGLPAVELQSGYAVAGKVDDALVDLATTLGARRLVQDGAVYLVERGSDVSTFGPLITPTSGLVGSPEPLEDGRIRVRCLLSPRLAPGVRFRVESREVTGFYRVAKVVHVGDSGFDASFYTEAEAVESRI